MSDRTYYLLIGGAVGFGLGVLVVTIVAQLLYHGKVVT